MHVHKSKSIRKGVSGMKKRQIIYNFAMVIFSTIILLIAFSNVTQALSLNKTCYVYGDSVNQKIPIPQPYVPIRTISQTGGSTGVFSSPGDLFIKDDFIYVADTGNNRILKITLNGEFVCEYTNANEKPFEKPTGVFVDSYNHIYVCDNSNARIVHMNPEGVFIEAFIKPQSELLVNVAVFSPYRVALSELTGFLYLIQGKQFMSIDAGNGFQGYVGANNVGFDFVNFLFRKFASDKQKSLVGKWEPDAYSSFCMTKDGLLYAVGMGDVNQIKVINSVGENIFRPGLYGEIDYLDSGVPIYPQFSDITVYNDTIITVTEKNTAKIFQYDSEGNILAVFGGKGEVDGTFKVPIALDVDGVGNLYVLDSSRNDIQVLQPTEFIKSVHLASQMYKNGKYDESMKIWENVSSIDATYPLARQNIGRILLKQTQYKKAMENFYVANDKLNYGKSFDQLRKDTIKSNFAIFSIGLIIIFTLLTFLIWILYKKSGKYLNQIYYDKQCKYYPLKLILIVIFHPLQFFDVVKLNRDRFRLLPVILILLSTLITRFASIYLINFSMAGRRSVDTNIVFEIFIIIVPLLTFMISNYALTSILGGECKPTELLTAGTYSLIPYIIFTPVLTAVSYLFSVTDKGLYSSLSIAVVVWIIILIFIGVKRLNDLSIKSFLLVLLLTFAGMVLILAIFLLVFALISQVVLFVDEFSKELKYLINNR